MEFLETLYSYWNLVRPWVGGVLCIAGGLGAVMGSVGVLRFPDFYTRTHAASMTDTLGAGLLLLGMACLATGWIVVFKLMLIFLFLLITVPTGSHAAVHAANVAGLEPLTGRYRSDDKNQGDDR